MKMLLAIYSLTLIALLSTTVLTSPTPPSINPKTKQLSHRQLKPSPPSNDLLPGEQYSYQHINLQPWEPVLHLPKMSITPLFNAVLEEIATKHPYDSYVPEDWSYDFAGIPKFEGLVFRAKVFRKYRWPALVYALYQMQDNDGFVGAPAKGELGQAGQPAFAAGVTWGPRDVVVAILKFCDAADELCPYAN